MGKGNKHRGGDDRRQDDGHGSNSGHAIRSYGGGDQKFRGTLGGTLGQPDRHSKDCFEAQNGVRSARFKIQEQEKALNANPDFIAFMKAKREMADLEKKLNAVPSFVEYQQARKGLRQAYFVLDAAKPKCEKCSFANPAKQTQAVLPQATTTNPQQAHTA